MPTTTDTRADVVVICALPLEADAMLDRLATRRGAWTSPQGDLYWLADHPHEDGSVLRVAVRQVGAGNSLAAVGTEAAIRDLQPAAALFVGVAGGVKDVSVADVVVGTQVRDILAGKEDERAGFTARPDAYRASPALLDVARLVRESLRSAPGADFAVFEGPIAAGNRVVAADAETLAVIKSHYSDTIAVEMEGFGFYLAAHRHPSVHALVVRGISDLILGKAASDAGGSQPLAAANAADVAARVIEHLPAVARYARGRASTTTTSAFATNAPPAVTRLIGRDTLIADLEQRLTAATITVLIGVSGVGKTAVATELARTSTRSLVWWVPCSTDEAADAALWELGAYLLDREGAAAEATDAATVLRRARTWLAEHDDWLLVLDDCAGPEAMRRLLPGRSRGAVLVTSTNAAWPGYAVTTVNVLGTDDSAALLADRTGEPSAAYARIANTLAGLPLALVQASGYMVSTAMPADEYAGHLEANVSTLLDSGAPPDHPTSVVATVDLALTAVGAESEDALQLALIMAWLAPGPVAVRAWEPFMTLFGPESDIPMELLIRDALARLSRAGLLRLTARDGTLHPLVSAIVRDQMAEPETRQRYADYAAIVALGAAKEAHRLDSIELAQDVLPHLTTAADTLADVYDTACLSEKIWLLVLVWRHIAGLYSLTRRYADAIAAADAARALAAPWLDELAEEGAVADDPVADDTRWGVDRWQVLDVLADLDTVQGLALADLGRAAEAVPMLRRALAIVEPTGDLQSVARGANNLALAYYRERKFGEALPLAERALRLDTIAGSSPAVVGRRHAHVAQAHHGLRHFAEAVRHCEAADELFVAAGEPEDGPHRRHLATLAAEARLGMAGSEGVVTDDLIRSREAAAAAEAADGHNRAEAITRNNLALDLSERGRHDDARLAMERSLMLAEATWGSHHPETIVRLLNAAVIALQAGDPASAASHVADARSRAEGAPAWVRGNVAFMTLNVALAVGAPREEITEAARVIREYEAELSRNPTWADADDCAELLRQAEAAIRDPQS